jgi:hypothetical protein
VEQDHVWDEENQASLPTRVPVSQVSRQLRVCGSGPWVLRVHPVHRSGLSNGPECGADSGFKNRRVCGDLLYTLPKRFFQTD